MKKHVKGIGGALLSLAFVLGVLAVAGNTAQAQYRDYGRYDRDNDRYQRERQREWRRQQEQLRRNRQYNNRVYNNGAYGGYGNSAYQYEIQRGYQQGINTGASDAQRGQSYSPQRSHFYRDGGYSQAFREGFVRGYDQGYRQYAGYNNRRYGNNTSWGNILGGILRP